MKTKEEARGLLEEWVKSDSLRNHCLCVALCMEAYAEKFGEDRDKWFICGLMHDFDWEKYPSIYKHPIEGCRVLRDKGYDEDIIEAILGHNAATGIGRKSLLSKTLFAVDELCGLIMALSKVRPLGFQGMNAQSVRKAMKKKDFAAAIDRSDIEQGILELGLDRKEHFELVIKALSKLPS